MKRRCRKLAIQTRTVNERVMPERLADGYRSCMDTKTFEMIMIVKEEDVQAAKEQLQAFRHEIKEQIPEAVVSEITTQPAPEERPTSSRFSEIHIN